ncbi:phospholipase A [Marinomonas posidonica]|uniref:phospholipase A n=1 Tax=Marinomonas posidonica TaxID=936476 RepID=UPI0037370E59
MSVETEHESESYFQAEEPEVPESISQRAKEANGLFQQREIRESATVNNPFVITPHRPNYFLPIAYTSNPNDRAFLGDKSDSESLQSVEFKFQLSVKFPVAYGVVGRNSSLWFAYTQQAYWQAYNSHISAPFRDTNHEPEAFIVVKPKEAWFGIKPSYITYGLNHQSNGQSGDLSRSWNRFYVDFLFETENTAFSIKPWYRFPESSDVDDNPDIEDYYGYGEFSMIHVIDDYSIDVMIRNNLDMSDNRGAIQVGFNFPLWGKTRGYIQYFNGYGQSLLDYNHQTQSLGIGVMLSNWL